MFEKFKKGRSAISNESPAPDPPVGDSDLSEKKILTENLTPAEAYAQGLSGEALHDKSWKETWSQHTDEDTRKRFEAAYEDYQDQGYSEREIISHLRGTNFHNDVGPMEDGNPGDILFRYSTESQLAAGTTGNYFTKDSPKVSLGIEGDWKGREDRITEVFIATEPYSGLKSTAADVHDWSGTSEILYGGGSQLNIPDHSGFEPLFRHSSEPTPEAVDALQPNPPPGFEVDMVGSGGETPVGFAEGAGLTDKGNANDTLDAVVTDKYTGSETSALSGGGLVGESYENGAGNDAGAVSAVEGPVSNSTTEVSGSMNDQQEALSRDAVLANERTRQEALSREAALANERTQQEALIKDAASANERTQKEALIRDAASANERTQQEALARDAALANERTQQEALTRDAALANERTQQEALIRDAASANERTQQEALTMDAALANERTQQEALTRDAALANERTQQEALTMDAALANERTQQEALTRDAALANERTQQEALTRDAAWANERTQQEALTGDAALANERTQQEALTRDAALANERAQQEALTGDAALANERAQQEALTRDAALANERTQQEALTRDAALANERTQQEALTRDAALANERTQQEALTKNEEFAKAETEKQTTTVETSGLHGSATMDVNSAESSVESVGGVAEPTHAAAEPTDMDQLAESAVVESTPATATDAAPMETATPVETVAETTESASRGGTVGEGHAEGEGVIADVGSVDAEETSDTDSTPVVIESYTTDIPGAAGSISSSGSSVEASLAAAAESSVSDSTADDSGGGDEGSAGGVHEGSEDSGTVSAPVSMGMA